MDFKKYAILPSELRRHALSYNDNNALSNYARCSKLCNEEVQRSHVHFPSGIKIEEVEVKTNSKPPTQFTRIVVSMIYPEKDMKYRVKFRTVGNNKHRIGTGRSSRYQYRGDAHQAAIEYIKNRLKYARLGKPVSLKVDMKKWPTDLMDIPGINKYYDWEIRIGESMYFEFYQWIKNCLIQNKQLTLASPNTPRLLSDTFHIPAQFFETDFFQNLASFHYKFPLPAMSVNSFLTMKATHINMNISTLPLSVINQKIAQWFAHPPTTLLNYIFNDRSRNPLNSIDDILQTLPIARLHIYRRRKDAVLHHENGDTGVIKISENQIIFITIPLYRFFSAR